MTETFKDSRAAVAKDITHPFNDAPDSGVLMKNQIDVAERVKPQPTQQLDQDLSDFLGLGDTPTAPTVEPIANVATTSAPESVAPAVENEETLSKKFFNVIGTVTRNSIAGVENAVFSAGQSVEALGDVLREESETIRQLDKYFGGKKQIERPFAIPREDGLIANISRDTANFMFGFLPVFRAMKVLLPAKAVQAGKGIPTLLGADATTGAVFFNEEDPLVLEALGEMPKNMLNASAKFFVSDQSPKAQAALKRAIDFGTLGAAGESVFGAIKLLGKTKTAQKIVSKLGGKKSVEEAVEETGEEFEDILVDTIEGEIPKSKPRPKFQVRVAKSDAKKAESLLDDTFDDINIEGRKKGINLENVVVEGFEHVSSRQDLKRVLAATAKIYAKRIDTARRGKITVEQTEKLANELHMPVERLLTRKKGELFNAEEVLASRKVLNSSGIRLKQLADEVASGNVDSKNNFVRQFVLHSEVQKQVSALAGETSGALRAFGIKAAPEQRLIEKLAEAVDSGSFGGRGIEDLADAVKSLDDPHKMHKFVNDVAQNDGDGLFFEYWYGALLSSPRTQMVNLFGGASNLVGFQIPERMLASVLGREVAIEESGALAFGLIGGVWDGLKLGLETLKSGEVPKLLRRTDKFDFGLNKEFGAEKFDIESGTMHGFMADAFGEWILRMSRRGLQTGDAFVKGVAMNAEKWALAARQAKSEGELPVLRIPRMIDLVDDASFLKNIKNEQLDFAEEVTFTRRLGEFGGRDMQHFIRKQPIVRIAMPFQRVQTNIGVFTGQRFGPLGLINRQTQADLKAGGAKAALARSKLAWGSSMLSFGAYLYHLGVTTGGGPTDPALQREWRESGWEPYSVNTKFFETPILDSLSGKVDYTGVDEDLKYERKLMPYRQFDPLRMFLGASADFVESMRGIEEEQEAVDLATSMTLAISRNYFSPLYAQGISDFVGAMSDPDRNGKRYLEKLSTSAIPTVSRQAEASLSPELSQVDGIVSRIKSKTPGLSKSEPPLRGRWGQKIKLDGTAYLPEAISPFYVAKKEWTFVDQEIKDLGITMRHPTRNLEGVEITRAQHDRLVVLERQEVKVGNKDLKQAIEHLIKNNGIYKRSDKKGGPDGVRAHLIRKIVARYRTRAKQLLQREFPEIKDQIKEKKLQKRGLSAPADPAALNQFLR